MIEINHLLVDSMNVSLIKRAQRDIWIMIIPLITIYPIISVTRGNFSLNAIHHDKRLQFNIPGKVVDTRDNLESVLSITHHDPSKAQEGLTIFTIWRITHHAPELHLIDAMIVITDMEGNVEEMLTFPIEDKPELGILPMDPEFIDSTTFVCILGPNLILFNNQIEVTEVLPIPSGHHDVEYNPITDTFLTVHFTQYGYFQDEPLLFDDIREYNRFGAEVWYWNSSDHIPFNKTYFTKEMFYNTYQWTHANTIFWDIEDHAIYYNCRHLDTFYKIDYPSGEILWAAGKMGNLKLFDIRGKAKESLFYHSHAVEVIGPNRFIIFDNDYFNTTRDNPQEAQGISRILEVIVNEETMTMNETWSWSGPSEYFGDVWGDADRLPNGNRLGTFGVPTHPAYITEVNPEGTIVWELALEQEIWDYLGIYNADRFFEAPLIEINQTDYTQTEDKDLEIQVRTWDTFDTRLTREGLLTITEGREVIESVDFTFSPHWQETIVNASVSCTGEGERTLVLTITNEDDLSTSVTITINGGVTTQPVVGWLFIPIFSGMIAITAVKKKKKAVF